MLHKKLLSESRVDREKGGDVMSVSITISGELAFPSKYIGAADLKGRDVSLTIANINIEELMMQGGRKSKKVVIWFEKTEKMMVCNKTNATTIAEIHGTEMKTWIGKRITLYPTTAKLGKKTVPAVRVREQAPQPAQQPPRNDLPPAPVDAADYGDAQEYEAHLAGGVA